MLAEPATHDTLADQLHPELRRLYAHPLLRTGSIRTPAALRLFMEHHVFAVFDFMSLAKSLQHILAPSGWYWVPTAWTIHPATRFINEIILGEESDSDGRGGYCSHFDLYLNAMRDVGADTRPVLDFVSAMSERGPHFALDNTHVPPAAEAFMRQTFDLIESRVPHRIAAAFAYGREHLIPEMFRRIVAQLELQGTEVDRFRFYLERHVELDQGEHGPMAYRLVEALCDGSAARSAEAADAARASIKSRIQLWDRVHALIANAG